MTFFAELKRRNVLRAAALYIGGVWALSQGLAQLFPVFGVPDSVVRWIVIAAAIGFPFFAAFAWYYEFTPDGLKRESEIAQADAAPRGSSRKLDFWIIGVLAVAVVLLLTNQLVERKNTATTTTPVPAATSAPGKSIAVLPLANDSGDKDQQYFSDGLSEDLITALSQFAGLKVISRNSAFQFRDSKDDSKTIGEKLGVAHLLEGSVRRAGDTVRISAALVKAADGSTLWSQRYDRPYKDLFKLQDEITVAVADALQARLLAGNGIVVQSDRPPSGDLQAYGEYIQGDFYAQRGSENDYRKAFGHYERAIAMDPRYARAYAALSYAWAGYATSLLGGTARRVGYDKARAASVTALALDPELAAAHNARGFLLTFADFDWTAAEASHRRALQLAPNDFQAQGRLAFLLAALGHRDQAIALARRTQQVDPLRAGSYLLLARYLTMPGRLDEAEAAIDRAIELQPGAASYHEQLTIIEVLRGNAVAALQAARKEPDRSWRNTAIALALQIAPDRVAADDALETLIKQDADTAAYQIAEVHALRKDPDKAFEWLNRAWGTHDPGISLLLFDPFLLRYKDDPRFAAFCRKVGLPPPEDAAVATPTAAGTTTVPAP